MPRPPNEIHPHVYLSDGHGRHNARHCPDVVSAVFAGLTMESLALLVFIIFSAVFLCGPLAIALAVQHRGVLAVLLAGVAIWLGIYWYVTVYTWAKYLGVLSAGCGLYAMYHVAHRLQVGP